MVDAEALKVRIGRTVVVAVCRGAVIARANRNAPHAQRMLILSEHGMQEVRTIAIAQAREGEAGRIGKRRAKSQDGLRRFRGLHGYVRRCGLFGCLCPDSLGSRYEPLPALVGDL